MSLPMSPWHPLSTRTSRPRRSPLAFFVGVCSGALFAGLAGWGVGGGALLTELPAAAEPVSPAALQLADPSCQWSAESHRRIVAFGYGERLTVRLRHGRKLTALPRYQVEGRNVWVVRVPRDTAEDDVRSVSVDRHRCETA